MEENKQNRIFHEDLRNSYPSISRKKMIDGILEDEDISNIIKRVAKRNDTAVFLVQRRAKKILKEMAADLSPLAIKLSYRFFKFMWKSLYCKLYVDNEGLEKTKPIIKTNPVVLIPSHKSHVDYLLISSIFHENELVPPYIAAGVNLAFWPFGYIFRKIGAFFIRRAIGTDILYFKILFKYMSFLIKRNAKQEFFIEGGRSRNGKVQNPKLGLLTLQIESYLEEDVENLYFLPISIMYDRILEENAYCDEIMGGKKAKESLYEVVKSLKVLKSRYGDAYVRFGEPISLKERLASYDKSKLTPKVKKKMIKELVHSIVTGINSLTPVSPTAVLALAALSTHKSISYEDILAISKLYIDYFKSKGVTLFQSLEAKERTLLATLTFLEQSDLIKSSVRNRVKFYKRGRKKRIKLDYYKNCILHHCFPLIAVACSINSAASKETTKDDILKDYEFLANLLGAEFIIDFAPQKSVDETLGWLTSQNIVAAETRDGKDLISVKDGRTMSFLAGALRNHIEAYYLTALSLEKITAGSVIVSGTDLVATIMKIGLRMLRKEEILTREAILVPYINNALKYINRNISRSIKNLMPVGDLEEDEEPIQAQSDGSFEQTEDIRLGNFKNALKKFLS